MDVNSQNRKPWRMLLPLAAVLVLAGLWSAYWYVAAGLARTELQRQRARLAAQGLEIGCASEDWGGYPFRFEFACTSPVLAASRHELSAASLRAYAQAYYPWHVLLLVDGPTRLQPLAGAPLVASHETLRASIRFRDESEPYVSAEIPKLDIEGLMTAGHLLISSRPEGAGAHGLAVSARNVNYQPTGRPPLPIASIEFLGTVSSGQTVEVHSMALQQGTVTYSGSGTVGLDRQHRISGTLHTETNDLDGLLAIVEPHLQMPEQQRAAFKVMLGLLVRDSKADIIAKDGELYIGPFKAADLLPIY